MLGVILLAVIAFLSWCWWLLKYTEHGFYLILRCQRVTTIDGSKLEDTVRISNKSHLLKNSFDFVRLNAVTLFNYARTKAAEEKMSYLQHFPGTTAYNAIRADDVENIMKDINLITKGTYYGFMHEFIGTGLLTSTGLKWHSRRKMLTPTFHFSILEQFLEIFKSESTKFVEQLSKTEASPVSLQKVIPKSTLNIICETALGAKLDEMSLADEYRKNIKSAEKQHMYRASNFLLYTDFMFNWFGNKKEHEITCNDVHRFTEGIVKKRRNEFLANNNEIDTRNNYRKKRYAMLDTLLAAEANGEIDHQGICEEVDTLTFEGYDTTSTGILFTIFMIALHPDVQQKCYDEILNITSSKPLDDLTVLDYSKFKYLECVIKESLRLFPPVHYISRKCMQETILGKLILPKDTEVSIHIFDLHRDPTHFPDPERFDPDRFLPENSVHRHPFAFIPFSAGLRNCIGQKFAMLELKTLLTSVLRSYEVLPVTKREELVFEAGLVLRTSKDVHVKFVKR